MSHFKTLNDSFPTSALPSPPLRIESKLFFKSLSPAFCSALRHSHFISCHILLSLGSYFTELLVVALTHCASSHVHVALCASDPPASVAAVTLAPCTAALSHCVLIVCLHFCSLHWTVSSIRRGQYHLSSCSLMNSIMNSGPGT